MAVTNDQFALATAYRNHGVDGLDTGLKRLVYRLAVDYTRSFALQRHVVLGAFDGALAVNGIAQGVYYAAEHALAYLNGGDNAGALNR